MPGYPPVRAKTRPPVHHIGAMQCRCRCGLWHEIGTTGQVVRVVCSCGRVVWEARPKPSYNNAPPVVLA